MVWETRLEKFPFFHLSVPSFTTLLFLSLHDFFFHFFFLQTSLEADLYIMAATNHFLADAHSYSPRYYVEEARRKFADFDIEGMQDYPIKQSLA